MSAQTFVDSLLSHVPEKGSHVVRSFGLFHPNCRAKLDKARYLLGQKAYEPITDLPSTQELLRQMFPDRRLTFAPIVSRRQLQLLKSFFYHRFAAYPKHSFFQRAI